MQKQREIRVYTTLSGQQPFAEWQDALRDARVEAAVIRRLGRVELGNFGDHKYLKDGVSELRIDLGPGFRIYYAQQGTVVVLLLCAGDKKTQRSDIERACDYWADWQSRSERGKL